jgi:hypothetical protein
MVCVSRESWSLFYFFLIIQNINGNLFSNESTVAFRVYQMIAKKEYIYKKHPNTLLF